MSIIQRTEFPQSTWTVWEHEGTNPARGIDLSDDLTFYAPQIHRQDRATEGLWYFSGEFGNPSGYIHLSEVLERLPVALHETALGMHVDSYDDALESYRITRRGSERNPGHVKLRKMTERRLAYMQHMAAEIHNLYRIRSVSHRENGDTVSFIGAGRSGDHVYVKAAEAMPERFTSCENTRNLLCTTHVEKIAKPGFMTAHAEHLRQEFEDLMKQGRTDAAQLVLAQHDALIGG